MSRRHLGLALLLALGAALPASAQSVLDRLPDLRLETAVRLALVEDATTRPLDVVVAARAGRVSLSGEVPFAERSRVVSVARAVPGVVSVEGLGASASEPPERAPTQVITRPAEPAPQRPAESSAAVMHTVQAGDTLFSLARRYNTTVDAVLRLNNMTSTNIEIGQRLRMR